MARIEDGIVDALSRADSRPCTFPPSMATIARSGLEGGLAVRLVRTGDLSELVADERGC